VCSGIPALCADFCSLGAKLAHRPFPLTCGEKGPVPSRIRSVQVWDGTKIFRPTLTTSIRRFSSWARKSDREIESFAQACFIVSKSSGRISFGNGIACLQRGATSRIKLLNDLRAQPRRTLRLLPDWVVACALGRQSSRFPVCPERCAYCAGALRSDEPRNKL
jgi:hypothetical protein